MAYVNRLTDINNNLTNSNNIQSDINMKVNNINGSVSSINNTFSNIYNNGLNVSDTISQISLNSIDTKIDTLTTIDNKLGGLLSNKMYGTYNTSNVPVKVDNMGAIYTVNNQLGGFANGLNNKTISTVSDWIDVSSYRYIVCYYEDTSTSYSEDISVEFSFTYDETTLIIPNINIIPNVSGFKRYGRLDKTYIPGINYIRLRNNSMDDLTNVFFTITGL